MVEYNQLNYYSFRQKRGIVMNISEKVFVLQKSITKNIGETA
ncbi:hypothetical protein JTS98_06065 [Clostridium botulinum]|nr:hypothetical protein [Clostridium botulinum]